MSSTKIISRGPVPMRLIPFSRDVRRRHFLSVGPAAGPRSRPSTPLGEALLSALADPRLAEIRHQAERMAKTDLPVLMLGNRGIANEAVGLMIHSYSARCNGPFARASCRAVAPGELERELFGCEIAAPWGFETSRRGVFEACNGGTVFLDGVTALPWHLQGRLLDLLDDRRLYRGDGRSWVEAGVRILASTSLDIDSGLATGRLRWDLYQRLNCLTLHFPRMGEQGVRSWKGGVSLEKDTSDWPMVA